MDQLNALLPGIHPVDEKAMDAVLEPLAGCFHPGPGQLLGKASPSGARLSSAAVTTSVRGIAARRSAGANKGDTRQSPAFSGGAVEGIVIAGPLCRHIPFGMEFFRRVGLHIQRRIGHHGAERTDIGTVHLRHTDVGHQVAAGALTGQQNFLRVAAQGGRLPFGPQSSGPA